MKKTNSYKVVDNIVYVKFNNVDEEFICDLEDWEKLKEINWWGKISKWGTYACATINGQKYRFHRLIMNCPDDMQVDHINGNTLDNRKCNLRVVTNRQNSINSAIPKSNKSGYKGIYFDKSRNKWVANIKINYKTIFLGRFENIEDAIKVRQKAEIEYFGEYRRKL